MSSVSVCSAERKVWPNFWPVVYILHFQTWHHSAQIFQPSNTTIDRFLFLLKTKFLGLDEVKGHAFDLSFHQVSHVCQCFCLYVQLVHRLCQSFKCGSWKSRLWARPSMSLCECERCSKTTTEEVVVVFPLVLSEVLRALSGRTVVLVISGLDVVVISGAVNARGHESINLIQIDWFLHLCFSSPVKCSRWEDAKSSEI